MSQENVEIVRRMYAAYLAGDMDGALAHFHPQVAADFSVRGDTGPTRGREALSETVMAWLGTWDDYSEQIQEIRDLGATVCVIAKQRGRGKGSGVEIENRWGQLYTVEDGLITSLTMYASAAQALEAAGVSE
jgi:uncharacterized protein